MNAPDPAARDDLDGYDAYCPTCGSIFDRVDGGCRVCLTCRRCCRCRKDKSVTLPNGALPEELPEEIRGLISDIGVQAVMSARDALPRGELRATKERLYDAIRRFASRPPREPLVEENERLRREVAGWQHEVSAMREAIEEAAYRADCLEALEKIGRVVGCGHVHDADGRAKLVHCVDETMRSLGGVPRPPREYPEGTVEFCAKITTQWIERGVQLENLATLLNCKPDQLQETVRALGGVPRAKEPLNFEESRQIAEPEEEGDCGMICEACGRQQTYGESGAGWGRDEDDNDYCPDCVKASKESGGSPPGPTPAAE